MIDNKEIHYFQNIILEWFDSNARNFQWRNQFLTPYEIIISEILLQRTKAETISKFYSQFLTKFPSWASLAIADLKNIEQNLMPIGLYKQRAKRLKNLALYMLDNKENLPVSRDELEKIPFMGQYIANAVELLIYKQKKPLLDVNMARVLERYFGKRKFSDIRFDPYLQELSHQIVNHSQSKLVNWAILDFAALVCKSRKPDCLNCILNKRCLFFQNNMVY